MPDLSCFVLCCHTAKTLIVQGFSGVLEFTEGSTVFANYLA